MNTYTCIRVCGQKTKVYPSFLHLHLFVGTLHGQEIVYEVVINLGKVKLLSVIILIGKTPKNYKYETGKNG